VDVPTGVGQEGTFDAVGAFRQALRGLGMDPFPANVSWPPHVEFEIPQYDITSKIGIYLKDQTIDLPDIFAPHITNNHIVAEKDKDDYLFEIPTGFDITPPADGNGLPLQNLDFAIAIAWQDGQLGLKISSSGDTKFKPFSEIGS